MSEQQYPKGWDEKEVKNLIAHYDAMTDEELADEDDAAFEADGMTVMPVPNELVEEVRAFIARRQSA